MINRLAIGLIFLTGFVMLWLNTSFHEINYNESAVITNRILGTTRAKQSGFIIKFPWNEIHTYKTFPSQLEQNIEVFDKVNESLKISVLVYYMPKRDQIQNLHTKYGQNYKTSILDSLTVATIKSVARNYTAHEIYSPRRVEVEIELSGRMKDLYDDHYIYCDRALIRSVELKVDDNTE